ncbi:FecR family protein [Lunatibacter salilacus]|uniref:FecR family protein n=1 Tax=Lunatibacter salilacus TaxID=2483804 RepID=UPI00131E47C2|nr:FecR domain-containing protein [Lunatibacter salilacus]
MDISNWTVDDFVLNAEFRKWILSPNAEINLVWEKRINAYPEKLREIKLARELLVNFPNQGFVLSQRDKKSLWERIDRSTHAIVPAIPEEKVIPLNSQSTIKRMERKSENPFRFSQGYKVAGILLVSFVLSLLATVFLRVEGIETETPIVFTEHTTRQGVKSTFTLPDSSTVMLNAGSRLYYQENFSGELREVFLEGEGYFEVQKKLDRPFIVHTGPTSTTALGTSFTIRAYDESETDVYLLSGKVIVSTKDRLDSAVFLSEGETVSFKSGALSGKKKFDQEPVTAWTKGVLLFDETPIRDAILVMENWYGVKFRLENDPPANLQVSGKFEKESLKNILTGLGYSARFEFEILGDTISVSFKKK